MKVHLQVYFNQCQGPKIINSCLGLKDYHAKENVELIIVDGMDIAQVLQLNKELNFLITPTV